MSSHKPYEDPTRTELQYEIERLRAENAQLVKSNQQAYNYIRSKVNQLLEVIGTTSLKPEELDNASMIEFDPIGIVSSTFEMVLGNLRETNRSLRFANDEIQAIFDAVGAALLVLAPDRRILAYNQKTKDLLLGRDDDVIGCVCNEAVCGDRADERECVFDRVLASGREQQLQDWQLDERSFNVVGRPMFDEDQQISHVVLAYTDVTARKKAEAALMRSLSETQEANSRIQGILRSVSDGLLVTDADDRIVLINRKAESLLGFCLLNPENPPELDIIPVDSLRSLLVNAPQGGPFIKRDLVFSDEEDGEIIYQARVTVIRSATGDYRGSITFLHDVTEQRVLDRAKSEFVSTAAHELRTPLATIIGYTDLLLHEGFEIDDKLRDYLNMIQQKAERLAEIVTDLLDISRIESGEALKLSPRPYRLDDLCDEILNGYSVLDDRHEIDVVLPGDAPVLIHVDRYAFSQVLENVISNAVKYSPDGGRIRLQATTENGYCQLSVTDQGIGMSPEQIEQVFDKFYRADATNTAISGTGLGMTIVKYLMEAQRGGVTIESEPARGTTVHLIFPLAPATASPCH